MNLDIGIHRVTKIRLENHHVLDMLGTHVFDLIIETEDDSELEVSIFGADEKLPVVVYDESVTEAIEDSRTTCPGDMKSTHTPNTAVGTPMECYNASIDLAAQKLAICQRCSSAIEDSRTTCPGCGDPTGGYRSGDIVEKDGARYCVDIIDDGMTIQLTGGDFDVVTNPPRSSLKLISGGTQREMMLKVDRISDGTPRPDIGKKIAQALIDTAIDDD